MARISTFVKAEQAYGKPQPTIVKCVWRVFDHNGVRYLQLDTLGSSGRRNPGKQSQTIQLNRDAASQLLTLLANAFPGLR